MSDLSQIPGSVSGEEILFFASLTEIESRPYYRADPPPKPKLVRLIGWYSLPNMVACCFCPYHRGHRKGFVAETADGNEIIVGNVCGGRNFPEFEILKRQFRDALSRQIQMERVARVISDRAQLLAKVEAMNAHPLGIDWLRRSMRNFERALPEVAAELIRRAQRKDTAVKRLRQLVGVEAEAYMFARNIKLRDRKDDDEPERVAVEETIGHLVGIEIFATSIRQIYVEFLLEPLNKLRDLDASALKAKDLKRWADWAASAPTDIQTAERLLDYGQEFFKDGNLELIRQMPWTPTIERKVREFRWDYARGTTKR